MTLYFGSGGSLRPPPKAGPRSERQASKGRWRSHRLLAIAKGDGDAPLARAWLHQEATLLWSKSLSDAPLARAWLHQEAMAVAKAMAIAKGDGDRKGDGDKFDPVVAIAKAMAIHEWRI